MPSTLISGRKYRDQLAVSRPFEAIHHALVRSDQLAESVVLQELFDLIRPVLDDVSCAHWISGDVRLDAQHIVSFCGVRP